MFALAIPENENGVAHVQEESMLSDVTSSPHTAPASPATAEALGEVNHLVKRYGRFTAANDVSFTIRRGEIFGLLGPNGAGKTTTLEIIEGLRRADGGQVTVDGLDVRRDRRAVQRRIGVQLQATTLFDALTVRETIHLFGAFYPSARSADDLLREVALEEKARAPGRRISLAASDSDSRSPWRWSTIPRCSCSMSRRRDSTRRAAGCCGRPSCGCARGGRRLC
jgi:ABC-type glutathione transport system ATPase component